MKLLSILVQMVLIIAGLMAVVGGIFYALCWASIWMVQFIPLIGRRHRHARWDEMNKRSGRQ